MSETNGVDEGALISLEKKKTELVVADAVRITRQVVTCLFGQEIPPFLAERFQQLEAPETITVSNTSFDKKLTSEGISPALRKLIKGRYDLGEDKIYCPGPASLEDLIHECWHFLSTDPSKHTGTKRATGFQTETLAPNGKIVFKENELLNESLTDLLSEIAKYNIDPTKPTAIFQLREKRRRERFKGAKTSRGHAAALVSNFFAQPKTAVLLPEALKDYLKEDKANFDQGLTTAVGIGKLDEFYLQLDSPPQREGAIIDELIKLSSGETQKLAPESQQLITSFKETVNGRNREAATRYVFPEQARGLVEIIPALTQLGIKAEVRINTGLADLYFDQDFRKNYLTSSQLSILVFWWALKLNAAQEELILDDDGFFRHEKVRKLLATPYFSNQLERLESTAHQLLGAVMDDESREAILSSASLISK